MILFFAKVRDLRIVIIMQMVNSFLGNLPAGINTEFVQLGIGLASLAMAVPTVITLVRLHRSSKPMVAHSKV